MASAAVCSGAKVRTTGLFGACFRPSKACMRVSAWCLLQGTLVGSGLNQYASNVFVGFCKPGPDTQTNSATRMHQTALDAIAGRCRQVGERTLKV